MFIPIPIPFSLRGRSVRYVYQQTAYGSVVYPPQPVTVMMPGHYYAAATYPPPTVPAGPLPQQPLQHQVHVTAADISLLREMFPNLEEDVIRSVLLSHNGKRDGAINTLLAMNEGH